MSEKVDSDGGFTFKVIKGLKGEIYSNFHAGVGGFENCPKIDALIRQTGLLFATLKTLPLKIDAAQDVQNLVLRFPFPKCKRKPREPN